MVRTGVVPRGTGPGALSVVLQWGLQWVYSGANSGYSGPTVVTPGNPEKTPKFMKIKKIMKFIENSRKFMKNQENHEIYRF